MKKSKAVAVVEDLRDEARNFYRQMQKSWLLFAQTIGKIRDSEDFKNYGHSDFKDFCSTEFPSMQFSTIVKTIRVAEGWGAELESKIEKDPSYRLPAYESCYTLTTAEKNITKGEFSKLRKNILEGKLSYHGLRSKLKDIIAEKREQLDSRSDEEIEAELVKDIEAEELEEPNFNLEDDVKSEGQEVRALTAQIRQHIDCLIEQIPNLSNMIQGNADLLTEDVLDVAKGVDELNTKIDDFLTKLEDVSE